MPRFAANLNFLYKEMPFLDRFSAAAGDGFEGVEILEPYDHAAPEILERLAMFDLRLALINAPPPNWTGGPRGFAALPGGQERFRHDFRRALRFARALGAERLHLMAGEAEGDAARATFVENLRWACAEAPKARLTIEPINTGDMPGYFLNDFDLAAEVLDEVAAPNLGLQFDVYHAQRITGDAMACWDRHGHRAVHVQIAQPPRRDEPGAGGGKGQIDYPAFFARLDATGYTGWVSAEYHPTDPRRTSDGMGWLDAARRS